MAAAEHPTEDSRRVSSTVRVPAGFLIAPFVPGVVLMAIGGADLVGGACTVPYSFAAEILFGLPAFVLFRRLRLMRLWHYCVGGLFGPVVAFATVAALSRDPFRRDAILFGLWLGALTATATAVFWFIAVRVPRRWRQTPAHAQMSTT